MGKKQLFSALFIVGAGLMLASNIQFAVGAVLATIGYSEFRKLGILDNVLDGLTEKVTNIVQEIRKS